MSPEEKRQKRIVPSSHPDKVRMLVLETDDLHPETQKEKDGFGNILGELFKEAGDDHKPSLGIETVIRYIIEDKGGSVPKAEEIGDDVHAILITGSVYDAHGDTPWVLKLIDLIKHLWVHRPDIKFSGICFGHQILCRTLGSEVKPEPNGEWEISHTPIGLTKVGKKLFSFNDDDDSKEPKGKDTIHLHQMHLDYVVEAPKYTKEVKDLLQPDTRVHVWGTSKHTGVQGCYIRGRMFTSQGHMEFNDQMVKRQLDIRVKNGALKEADASEAAESADWMHDGLLVAKAVLRFFHGEDDELDE